jgi:hypothetical protein
MTIQTFFVSGALSANNFCRFPIIRQAKIKRARIEKPAPLRHFGFEWETDLLQRRAGRACAGARVVADHTRLVRVEAAGSGRPWRNWIGNNGIPSCRSSRAFAPRELISALGTTSQNAVNQIGAGRVGCCATRRRCKRCKRPWIANARIRGRIRYGSRIERTERTDCGRFVGRHTRTEQVRDGNRRDDQNDRHDDQQFDKRETLLLFQDIYLILECKNQA